MSVEWFLKLKEIDSLTKMKHNYLKQKQDQEDRVSKLKVRQAEALMQTAKLKQELISGHQSMAEIEVKIKSASEQKQRILDIGGDEGKIQHYAVQISDLEEQGFVLLNQMEEMEKELTDSRTFGTGIENSIKEIAEETTAEIAALDREVENISLRIDSLMEELPPEFKTTLLKISSRNLAHGPFTRMENGSCYFCRYKISRLDESEIDMHKGLKTCPQCSRIFLPYGA